MLLRIVSLLFSHLGAQKNSFGTSKLVCEEKGRKLSDVEGLRKALRSNTGRGMTYWLPYRKVTLTAWTWVNNDTYSNIIFIINIKNIIIEGKTMTSENMVKSK